MGQTGGGNISGDSGTGSHRNTPHNGVHSKEEGDHIGKGGMLPHLLTLCRGGEEPGEDMEDDMVGPGRGKQTEE